MASGNRASALPALPLDLNMQMSWVETCKQTGCISGKVEVRRGSYDR